MMSIDRVLRSNGYRLTQPRKDILSVLTYVPLSAAALHEALKQKGSSVDKATVYRTLERFVSLGVVSKIQFDETGARYELIEKSQHHHHIICKSCGNVENIEMNERSLLKTVGEKTHYKITGHSVEFFGICKPCQSHGEAQ